MGAKERRQREREELREKILEAARTLFVEQGYEAVTMRGIAERIEYSPTSLYLYFSDKESLFRAICDEDFGALARRFQSIARLPDPVERLRAIGRAYAQFGLEHPNHYRLMFMTPAKSLVVDQSELEKGNPEEDAYAFLRRTVEDALAAGRFRDRYRDADLVAQLLWSGMHGVVSLRIIMHEGGWVPWRGEGETIEAMIEALLHGLLAGGD